ncbi:MAG: hypothetical protein AMXMBFR23_24960 [Chloroflexota bacterium]
MVMPDASVLRLEVGLYRCPGPDPGSFGYLLEGADGWIAVDASQAYLDEAGLVPEAQLFTCPSRRPADAGSRDAGEPPRSEPAEDEPSLVIHGGRGHQIGYRSHDRILFAGELFEDVKSCGRPEGSGEAGLELELLASALRLDVRLTLTASGQLVPELAPVVATCLERLRRRCSQVMEAISAGFVTAEALTSALPLREPREWGGAATTPRLVNAYLALLVDGRTLVHSRRGDEDRYYVDRPQW